MTNLPRIRGFTLIELMITLAIAALLLVIGLPSFNQGIRNNRLTTNTNEFLTALNLARSEAIKRGQQVVVRKTGTNWEDGWQVFADIDRDAPATDANTFNDDGDGTLCESTEDCVLRVYDNLPLSYTLRGNNFANFIRYTTLGQSNTNGSFVICDSSDGNTVPEPNTSRLIVINSVGRIRIGRDSNNDGIPNKDTVASTASNITSCVPPF